MSDEFVQALAELEEEKAISLAEERLAAGEDPLDIMDDLKEGMGVVGQRFDEGEYFIPDLMYAGEILEQISELIKDELPEEEESETVGTVVVGTVKDDIHDIGKDLVVFMFDLNGFEVHDLGVDVPPEEFVEKVEETDADILALSGFLTAAFESMKETVEAIEDAGLRDDVRIMIGGGQITEDVNDYVGSDAFETSAPAGVTLAKQWVGA
ncbi:MAG: B12-binding domain-containing protein [Halobacteriales archaeon]